MVKNLTFWCGIVGVFLFVLMAILGGFQFSNYSHISQLLSETYAIGTPHGIAIRYFGYIPSGILITTFSFLAIRNLPKSDLIRLGFTGIGIFYGIGTIIVGLFPCDPGCNKDFVNPSLSHLIHSLSGLLTYLFVPASLALIGLGLRKTDNHISLGHTALICGITCFIFAGLFLFDQGSNYIGIFQRVAEASVLVWIIVCSVFIKNSALNSTHPGTT